MKVLVVAVLVLAAFLQAEARSIGINQELPKALQETMEQSFACAMKLGSKASTMPKVEGLNQLPEDNEALNQLWSCIFIKKGIINENNEVNSQKLHDYLMSMFTMFVPANDMLRKWADEITDTCKAVEANEYQLRCIRIQNCINKEVKERTGV